MNCIDKQNSYFVLKFVLAVNFKLNTVKSTINWMLNKIKPGRFKKKNSALGGNSRIGMD